MHLMNVHVYVLPLDYVKTLTCSFEEGNLCDWYSNSTRGKTGFKVAKDANSPYPSIDTNPGNANGMIIIILGTCMYMYAAGL